MTIERFKNTWQPPIDGYERFSFDLDLKELEQQIRAEVIDECVKELEQCYPLVNDRDVLYGFSCAIQRLKQLKENNK